MIFDQIDLITFEIEHEIVQKSKLFSRKGSFRVQNMYFVQFRCSKSIYTYLRRVHIDSPNDGALGSLIQKLYDFYSRK